MSKLLFITIVIASSSVAWADDAADPEMKGPPTKDPMRQGVTVTLSMGPGEYHMIPDDGDETRIEGPAFSLRAGAAFSQVSAIEATVTFVSGSDTSSLLLGGALKFYTNDSVYIRGGAGIGTIKLGGGDPTMGGGSKRFWGPGALAGVGYEWFQLRDIALFGELEAVAWKPGEQTIEMVPVDPKMTILSFQVNFGITWF